MDVDHPPQSYFHKRYKIIHMLMLTSGEWLRERLNQQGGSRQLEFG